MSISLQAAGDVDPGFDGSVQLSNGGEVRKIIRQSDGKIIASGTFNAVNGHGTNSIARFNSDGTIDKTFTPSVIIAGRTVYAFAAQSNGKVLVSAGSQVIRLNADGTQDTTFPIINAANATPFTVYSIKVLADDSFYIGGSIAGFTSGPNIKKYNANGTQDSSFASTFVGISFKIDTQPDGKIIAAGSYASSTTGFIVRLLTDGTLDSSFTNVGLNGFVYDFAAQTDGKIVFGGGFTTVNSSQRPAVGRITGDGVFDPTFAPVGPLTGSVFALRIRPDGKVLIGGNFRFTGTNKFILALLNTDGTVDNGFVSNVANDRYVQAVELTAAGKVLAGFYFSGAPTAGGILGLNADGSTDTSAVYYVSKLAIARKIIEQPDGKIIVAGLFFVANNVLRPGLARFNTDGTLDTTFNPVFPGNPNNVFALALQADGKILLGTSGATNQPLVRLNSDGSLDSGFNLNLVNSGISEVVVLSSGKILVSGTINDGNGNANVARFNADGSRDNATFISTTEMAPTKIVVLPNGKFLGIFGSRLLRYNENGSVDVSFNAILEFSGSINDIDVQPDGKIVVVGSFTSLAGNSSHKFIGRLSSEGFSDPTFSTTVDGFANSVKVQPDGKILVGGQFAFVGGLFHSGMARLNSDGSVDSGFTANTYDIVWRIILLNSGKIFIGGQFNTVNGISRVSIARLNNNLVPARTPFDFDGDGRADIVAYRPSNSVWYQLLGVNYQFSAIGFGTGGDVVAPADFDGDGKTDIAIFRPSTGVWWYASSAQSGAYRAVQWGASGDIPLPSDVDGDGKSDYVVYRPSNSTWYRLTSAGQSTSFGFGIANDKPVIGDFDGDGKSDYAVYRPSTGVWWYAASSQNNATRAVQFGASEDIPVPADFDGDGRTDIAVFRPSNGGWYILRSGNNSVTTTQFGLSGDKPVAGDYDGDGKADIAVYRPSNGGWYLQRSTAGFTGVQFGTSTDVPIPNAFQQ